MQVGPGVDQAREGEGTLGFLGFGLGAALGPLGAQVSPLGNGGEAGAGGGAGLLDGDRPPAAERLAQFPAGGGIGDLHDETAARPGDADTQAGASVIENEAVFLALGQGQAGEQSVGEARHRETPLFSRLRCAIVTNCGPVADPETGNSRVSMAR